MHILHDKDCTERNIESDFKHNIAHTHVFNS